MTERPSGDELRTLMNAGSAALTFNAPMSQHRASDLIHTLASWNASDIVDFGCGRGSFATTIAAAIDSAHVVGIDNVAEFIHEADADSAATFDVADASTWSGPCDVAISIGSSHAFGGPVSMLDRFADLGARNAIVGDGFWMAEPDEWCVEIFGDMPAGLEAVQVGAEEQGWEVLDLDKSSIEEWDTFESGWRKGIRDIGTDSAGMLADEREAEYTRYRGVLGFSWLCARRADEMTI